MGPQAPPDFLTHSLNRRLNLPALTNCIADPELSRVQLRTQTISSFQGGAIVRSLRQPSNQLQQRQPHKRREGMGKELPIIY
jgi:hypothetical protein